MTDVELTDEQGRLVLAFYDMRQAAAAARLLDQHSPVAHARRALEPAMSVCDARSWKSNTKLRKEGLPAARPTVISTIDFWSFGRRRMRTTIRRAVARGRAGWPRRHCRDC